MRRARLKGTAPASVAYYHCLSRVVDRRFIFGDPEKTRFVELMRELEGFCRVRILTFCVMSNHFHLLVEVPARPEALPGPEEIVAGLRKLSGYQDPGSVRQRFDTLVAAKDEVGIAAYLATFHARMYDVSAYMKLLKQRFTQWYNGRHGRKGTLWEERFRSVLVEGAGASLVAMAAYIDLNPVRAGLVTDPVNYPWCGYADAVAGDRAARSGLHALVSAMEGGAAAGSLSGTRAVSAYRVRLYLDGDERRDGVGPDQRPLRGSLRAESVAETLSSKGALPLSNYLHCRVRYFCDGVVLGSRQFVEGVFREQRWRFGSRRKSGARRLRGVSDADLYTVRDLKLRVFGHASAGPVQPPTPPARSGRDPA